MRASVTFSRMVLLMNRLNDWNTMPTSALRFASSLAFLWQGLAVDADVAGIDGLEAIDGAAHRGLA